MTLKEQEAREAIYRAALKQMEYEPRSSEPLVYDLARDSFVYSDGTHGLFVNAPNKKDLACAPKDLGLWKPEPKSEPDYTLVKAKLT